MEKISTINARLNNQRGQTLIEYLIIVALVGVGSIALMRAVSQQINFKFAAVVKGLGGSVEEIGTAEVRKNMMRNRDMKDFASGALARSPSEGSRDNDSK
jgi:pilus assembly protein Flp/PilA